VKPNAHQPVEPRICEWCGKTFTPKVRLVKPTVIVACSALCRSRKAYLLRKGPPPERKTCTVCGEGFTHGRRDLKYCSQLCRSRSRGPEAKAAYWQKYYAHHHQALNAKTTSRRAAQRRPVKARACEMCGESFTPIHRDTRFCSRTCLDARVRKPEQEECYRLHKMAKTAHRRATLPTRACED
jgi:hypothetical protein